MIVAIHLLLLLLIVNGAPVIAHKIFGEFAAWPIDGGRTFVDGAPWLGSSKTWRGLLAAVLAGAVGAVLLGMPPATGIFTAGAAMLGDLLSSFTKRRLGIPPSGMTLGLDQIPESLLPTLLLGGQFGLTFSWGAAVVLAFVVLELVLSRLLFRLHIRKRPY